MAKQRLLAGRLGVGHLPLQPASLDLHAGKGRVDHSVVSGLRAENGPEWLKWRGWPLVGVDAGGSRVQHSAVSVNPYDVFEVPGTASERSEPMGSRTKFWFRRDDNPWLFKATRPNHGEDWAEVLAAELAEALGLPHARYQLATWSGQQGVVTPTFQHDGFDLVHGNELLQRLDPTYPREGMRYVRTPKHTIAAVSEAPRIDARRPARRLDAPGRDRERASGLRRLPAIRCLDR